MRTKLTLRVDGGPDRDIVVTTDVSATVGDVADALARAAPGASAGSPQVSGAVTLEVETPDHAVRRSLRRSTGMVESGIRAGSWLRLVPGGASVRHPRPGDPCPEALAAAAARLTVLFGPDQGAEHTLPTGVSTIGRHVDADVPLTDPRVEPLHARVHVSEDIEIVDAGTSGLTVGDSTVERAVLRAADVVLLGDTVIRVTPLAGVRTTGVGAVVPFNRSPRVVPRLPPDAVEAPVPPEPASSGRFPLVALVAPLLLGAVLWVTMHNPLSLIFVGLSPVLMLGAYLDKHLAGRREWRHRAQQFRRDLDRLDADLARRHEAERRARLGEAPSTGEAVLGARQLSPLLWARRPEHPEFLVARLGTGRAPARTTVALPPRGRAVAEHWEALEEVSNRFSTIDGVPVTVDLRECGAIGVVGRDRGPARGLVAQLVCLHSPAELVVAGLVGTGADDWRWLAWLPHTTSPHSPLPGPHLASSPAAALTLVTHLEELVAARATWSRGDRPVPAVLVLVEDDAPVDRGRVVRLAEEGPSAGVHVLWCAGSVQRLPAVCRAFVQVENPGASATVGLVLDGRWTPVEVEPLALATAGDLARDLAAVVDAGAPVVDESDLPRTASFLALAGADLAEDPDRVAERWRQTSSLLDRTGALAPSAHRPDATLRALVGQGPEHGFVLDLRTQGPHALVGGTTGSGKSEFLQTWVLGMAAAHSPDRVSFLFVDYKGGSAFADCVHLPHAVGLVTDLSPHLVRRALASLRAELRRRERLLQRTKAKDLLTLERAGHPETPPALVIVVDEFAALATEVPEFVEGVIDVARRGRSLGLHLILATQRPAGVITDNLRANAALRIALRMADEHDSVDVLGSPVAAQFDPGVPGRGAVRTGPGRIALFQSGYAGGRTAAAPPPVTVGVESLSFGPGEPWDVPSSPAEDPHADGPTDVARIVGTIGAAAQRLDLPAPRRPWLPELEHVVPLERLLARAAAAPVVPAGTSAPDVATPTGREDPGDSDGALVLGLVDLPALQEQRVLHHRPDRDGALVAYGTSGSGTSTLLRTLVLGAGRSQGPTWVYGLDFGAGGLAMLEDLPHVGSVVEGRDTERVARTMRMLRDLLDERASRYAAARAGTIAEYRALTGDHDEPRILLVVDGLAAFREAYESEPGRAQSWSVFGRVLAEGRPLGVHVAMAAERPGALPTALAGSVPYRVVLRQADETAYGALGVPADVLGPQSPPGRAVIAGTCEELQIAVAGGPAPAQQAAAVAALAERLRASGARPAPPIRRLSAFVRASSLPTSVDGLPLLGLADETLAPVGFDPRGSFLLAGLPGSGRTTALAALGSALRRFDPDARLYFLGGRRSPVHAAGVWTRTAAGADEAAALASALLIELAEPPDGPGIVLVVEGLSDFLGGPAEAPLTQAVKAARRNDHLVIAESETSTWGSSWPLVAEVRNGRRGLVLQPDHLDGDALFRTPFPRMARADFPPGRGVLVEHGRLRRVQVPVPD
ncbi:FtsK/SpoIIIE domain-containing protein [Isoptericola sp. b490]|uniref:FtsK/SpoIIIE domain-containing protein n=1 Tax=Actinotalea lenta TaxID=3064654 RepID=UPI0027123041|nr:FtsK/SpoIIIE domain-containing protein [Isoptericola sp. b490]MDO8122242.1 FtsK/SpoIIIE domain-containing protein [Isoptericola sp. b490]